MNRKIQNPDKLFITYLPCEQGLQERQDPRLPLSAKRLRLSLRLALVPLLRDNFTCTTQHATYR